MEPRVTASRLCAAALLAVSAPAAALDNDTRQDPQVLRQAGETGAPDSAVPEERDAVIFAGIGLSKVRADFSNVSDAINLDLAAGAHVPVLTWLSGEIDFSFTVAPGNNHGVQTTMTGTPCTVPPSPLDPNGTPDGCDPNATTPPTAVLVPGTTRSENDLQMTNIGAFAALRTPGRFYVLGKYGYRYINCSLDEIQHGSDQDGWAWSYGAGWRWGVGLAGVELAYTRYSSQLEYVGLALAYGFGASPGAGPH